MYEIAATSQSPYSSVSYLRTLWPDGSMTRASGVVVGLNDVLTALHAVFDTDRGGWARRIDVYPGADTQPYFSAPFGVFNQVGSIVGRAPNWDTDADGLLTSQESEGDLAVIGFAERIGDTAGWLPVAALPVDFGGVAAGYPARGTGLMGELVLADASSTYGVYHVNAGLGAGASGGPLLYSSGSVTSVVGVLSSGTADNSDSTYAGLFGTGTWTWLHAAMAANDTLLGLPPGSAPAAGPSVYMGTAAGDVIVGSAGRDVFSGLSGDDVFDGSDGIDTAVYGGPRASYSLAHVSSSEMHVIDSVQSRDGRDTLRNVERIRFDDLGVAFDVDGSAGQAYRLYGAAFGRVPDLPGLGFQMNALDSGLTLAQVAGNFLASPEFANTYGSTLTDEEYVTQLYANVLKRAPDGGGLQYHLEELGSGLSRAVVLTHFSESPENKALLIGTMELGMAYVA